MERWAGVGAVVAVASLCLGLDWRSSAATCVRIPSNMSLCYDIGYDKMRLPNLLEHDTMAEVWQQASSWVPLLNLRCHRDSQLFLCSLFSPVCLDRPVYPCRSLCQRVRLGCEGRMKAYGFPWPDVFRCDRFPPDGDLCVTRPTLEENTHDGGECHACNQALTYENILDNFCRADFAIRAKFRRVSKKKLTCKKTKVLKGRSNLTTKLRHPVLILETEDYCCEKKTRSNNEIYLIMGFLRDHKLTPSFIMPWQSKVSKPFKRAVRMFTTLNCTDPQVSYSVLGDAFPTELHKKLKKNNTSKPSKTNRSKSRKQKERGKHKKRKSNNSTSLS